MRGQAYALDVFVLRDKADRRIYVGLRRQLYFFFFKWTDSLDTRQCTRCTMTAPDKASKTALNVFQPTCNLRWHYRVARRGLTTRRHLAAQ